MSTQEFLLARVEALQDKVIELEAKLKLENENKRMIVTDLQMDIDELVNVIKGLDPTNPILQYLTI